MQYRLFFIVIFLLLPLCSTVRGQNSCTDSFEGFTPIEPEVHATDRSQNYSPVVAWYSDNQCVLVGSSHGLWLYDIDQPGKPVTLAKLSDSAIANIVVNPSDSTIAFSVAQEPVVYLLQKDGTTNKVDAINQAITSLAFSRDGTRIAIGSSNIVVLEYGAYVDAKIQILDTVTQDQLAVFSADNNDTSFIRYIFFTSDNKHLLTDGIREGYMGDTIQYWDMSNAFPIWSYDDLFRGLKRQSINDPLLATRAVLQGNLVALGGLYGYMDYDDYYGYGVHLWDAEQQERTAEIVINTRDAPGEDNFLTDIAFNSDGTVLITANANGAMRLWNTSEGSLIRQFDIETSGRVRHIAFSPDDRFLRSGLKKGSS